MDEKEEQLADMLGASDTECELCGRSLPEDFSGFVPDCDHCCEYPEVRSYVSGL